MIKNLHRTIVVADSATRDVAGRAEPTLRATKTNCARTLVATPITSFVAPVALRCAVNAGRLPNGPMFAHFTLVAMSRLITAFSTALRAAVDGCHLERRRDNRLWGKRPSASILGHYEDLVRCGRFLRQ